MISGIQQFKQAMAHRLGKDYRKARLMKGGA